jgi:hypothetical protein
MVILAVVVAVVLLAVSAAHDDVSWAHGLFRSYLSCRPGLVVPTIVYFYWTYQLI